MMKPMGNFLKIDMVLKHIEELISSSSETSPWNEVRNLTNRLNYLLILAKSLPVSKDVTLEMPVLLELIPMQFQNSLLQIIKTKEHAKLSHFSSSFSASAMCQKSLSSFSCSANSDSDDDSFDVTQGKFDDSFETGDFEELIESRDLSLEALNEKDKALLSLIEYLARSYEITSIADPNLDLENFPFTNCVKLIYNLVESNKTSDKIILDPLRTWSLFSVNNDDVRMSINADDKRLSKLPNLLTSPYHRMRMKVVENAELSKDFLEDEKRCRVSSFLLCLVEVANSSDALEPQALFAIISSVKVNNIDINIVKTALSRIVLPSNVQLDSYLDFHMTYILNQWLKDKHPLDEFPYLLFDKKDFISFVQHYRTQIILSLFALDEGITELEKLSDILHEEVKILLRSSFPHLMASLFPYLVISVISNERIMEKFSKTKISIATRKWKFLENVLDQDCLTSHIKDDIGEVVLNLLRMTYDSNLWNEEEVNIPSSHYCFDSETILFILNRSHDVFFKDQISLLHLLCCRKSGIHSILDGLLRDVASSMAMKSHPKCCDLLYDMIIVCLNDPSSVTILISTLPSIIISLYSLHSINVVWNYAQKVLVLIFNSDSEEVRKLIASMAPFTSKSDDNKLSELHTRQQRLKDVYQKNLCLKQSIEIFLAISNDDVTSFDIENILHLLSEKHLEICELYSSHSQNGLNLAHQLIFKIVEIVGNTKDDKNRISGLEIIGRLGPVPLGSSVFLISSNDCLRGDLGMLSDILNYLNRQTFSSHYEIVDTCQRTLRQILAMKEVYIALTTKINDKALILDLLPFLPARKPRSVTRLNEDLSLVEFESKISNELLWIEKCNFESWLKNLTVSLIEAGCGSDIFNHLIPICKLDVKFCDFTKEKKIDDSHTHLQRNASESHIIKSCLRTIIKAINFLRTQEPPISFSNRTAVTSWDRNLWVDVEFPLLSKAAFMCGAFYSSILFGEIACGTILETSLAPASQNQIRYLPPLQRIANSSEGRDISHLLLKASNALGDSEGVEGCGGLSSITDGVVQSTLSLHRGHEAQALYLCDAIKSDKCLADNLKNVGMFHTLFKITQ
ncbi:Serine-protein kinase ATM, partial [Armadillidium nasatum]